MPGAGPETICWRLTQHHNIAVARHLPARGMVIVKRFIYFSIITFLRDVRNNVIIEKCRYPLALSRCPATGMGQNPAPPRI